MNPKIDITFTSYNFQLKQTAYLSRFGAQTIARFLQVMPVLSLNDAMRDKWRIRNAQVLHNDNSQYNITIQTKSTSHRQ